MCGSLALTALVARGLSVGDYGAYRYAITFLTLGMTLLQFGVPYSLARLLAVETDPAAHRRYVGLGVAVVVAASCLGAALTVVAAATSGGRLVSWVLVWVSPALAITLGQAMIAGLCQGLGRIQLLSAQQVLPYAILIPATGVQIYWLGTYSVEAALIGYAATYAAVIAYGFSRLGPTFSACGAAWHSLRGENARTGFPIYIGGIFGVASAQFVAMWAAAYVDSERYGYYALALSISAPLQVLVASVGTVIFRDSARRSALAPGIATFTLFLAATLAAIYAVATEYLIAVLFGAKYTPAVPMAQWLGVGALLVGLGDVLQRFLGAHGLGKRLAASAVATGIVGVSMAALLLPRYGAWGAITSGVMASATYFGVLLGLYVWFVRTRPEAPAL